MSLTGKTKASSYKDILQMNNSNSGVDATTRTVVDGKGDSSALKLSNDVVKVAPQDDDTAGTFAVTDNDNNALFTVDSSNDLVKAGIGQHIVNTQIKGFNLSSSNSQPTTADTWSMMAAMGQDRFTTDLQFGTGSTPATTYTVATTAMDLVQAIWYLPFNITIDSVNVWFGQDAATGEAVKFSVMSYDIVTAPTSSGGDLSNGAEVCVSPSTVAGFGYEQAYMQNLTISTADVDAGKVIMAGVSQASTNSDLTVNMQLVYHLR
jgi:hypothetical protein